MSNNNNLAQDAFEQLVELGQSTAKQSVKAVAQVFNPLTPILEKGKSSGQADMEKQMEALKKDAHTPLNFDKLNDSYKNQDLSALTEQRRFLNRVKGDEEKAIFENKQKEEERKRLEAMAEAQKRVEEQQKTMEQAPAEVHGKTKGIFGQARPKAIVEITPEAKPSKSKG